MGFIRGSALVIVAVLFFVALLASNSFLTLSSSLEYDIVKPKLVPVIIDIAEEEFNLSSQIDDSYSQMLTDCENNSTIIFDEEGFSFEVPCEKVREGKQEVIDYGVNSLVDEVYYKNYDCGFWDCAEEGEPPFFLVSQKAQGYWSSLFYFVLGVLILLFVVIFFLVEKKSNAFIIAGALLMVSALPFAKIIWVASFLDKYAFQFFAVLFSRASLMFLRIFIFGIIVLGVGILMKFFGIGFWISNLVNKISGKKTIKEKIESK